MNSLERLRLAAALGHTVPGAVLRLQTTQHEEIVVSAHPAGDISPCAMRRVIVALSCPTIPDHSEKIARIDVGGSLEELGGGVYGVVRDGVEQRWIASLLKPDLVADLLDVVGVDSLPDDVMHGCLKPDTDLGVTLLVVSSNDRRYDHALDEVAAKAAATIFAEELLRSATGSGCSAQRSRGVS